VVVAVGERGVVMGSEVVRVEVGDLCGGRRVGVWGREGVWLVGGRGR
jgi:hypothetical protein